MLDTTDKKVFFFGCPIDCDEQHVSIEEKHAQKWRVDQEEDPLVKVMNLVSQKIPENYWQSLGSIEVPSWLRPQPPLSVLDRVNADAFIKFIEGSGYLEYVDKVEKLVKDKILPDIPGMIVVDHCLTGGCFKAVSEYYGPENVSLIVLDSHTDAIPISATLGAIHYDIETNRHSVHDKNDPLLYDRKDSYNASSFLRTLLSEEIVEPENLYLIGISDYPSKTAFQIKDRRIVDYVNAFSCLKKEGVKIITKKDYRTTPFKLKNIIQRIKTPYIYLSIDLDIGSRNAVEAVRFTHWEGLAAAQIKKIMAVIESLFKKDGKKLVGFDLNEFNCRLAGRQGVNDPDHIYDFATELIEGIMRSALKM